MIAGKATFVLNNANELQCTLLKPILDSTFEQYLVQICEIIQLNRSKIFIERIISASLFSIEAAYNQSNLIDVCYVLLEGKAFSSNPFSSNWTSFQVRSSCDDGMTVQTSN